VIGWLRGVRWRWEHRVLLSLGPVSHRWLQQYEQELGKGRVWN
jgi:hypothetical protein